MLLLQLNGYHDSLLQPEFYNVAHTKQQYEEFGPSLVRRFSVFGSST